MARPPARALVRQSTERLPSHAGSQVASKITPVPGGVGPMTIAMLMRNTLNLARNAAGLPRQPLRKTPTKH